MKKTLAILAICILILGLAINAYAAEGDSFKVTMEADKTSLKPGDTISIDLYIDDIVVASGDKGIGAYTIEQFKYDLDIFESPKALVAEEWAKPTFTEIATGLQIVAERADGNVTKLKEKLGIIQLTVKADAKSGSTAIVVGNVSGANGDPDDAAIVGIGSTLNVTITGNSNNDGNNTVENITGNTNATVENIAGNTNTTENIAQETNNNANTSGIINITSNMSSDTSSKDLPAAGITNVFIIGLAILAITSLIAYIKYKKV